MSSTGNRRPRECKLVLLGESGVGKSSLVLRFVTNNFRAATESTIGASFMSKMILVDGAPIKFQIWDTAGQEKYHSLAPMYYKGAAAAIIVYDITQPATFATLKKWCDELRAQGPENIAIAVAGNKSDLEGQRQVDETAARAYAEEIGAEFLETSAKDSTGVVELFERVSRKLPAEQPRDLAGIDLDSAGRAGSSGGGCC